MTEPRMSALDPGGRQAGEIGALWDVFLWVSIVVWVLVAGFLAASAIVARRARHRGEANPLATDARQDRRLQRGIVVAAAATVVTLLALLVASIAAGDSLADLEDDAHALHVRITGHQWWWEVSYDHDEPRRAAVTANELYLPVGQVVHLELRSADVIHSFWVPSLHGKKDLVPGRTNRTWLRIDEPGVYRGQCAEFCGLEHAKMGLTIVAVPAAEFEAWRARQRTPAATPEDPVARRGLQVFTGGPCALCHTIAGTSAGGRLGPDLTHLASRRTLAASSIANTRGHLTGWIVDPQGIKPGARMPATWLPAEDLHALVTYLEGLE